MNTHDTEAFMYEDVDLNSTTSVIERMEALMQQAQSEQNQSHYRRALHFYERANALVDSYFEINHDFDYYQNSLYVYKASLPKTRLELEQIIESNREPVHEIGIDREANARASIEQYRNSSSWNLFLQALSLTFAIIFLSSQTPILYDLRTLAILCYFPFGITMVAYALIQRWRLIKIDYDPGRLLGNNKLWARNSIMDRFERAGPTFMLLKFSWFIFAFSAMCLTRTDFDPLQNTDIYFVLLLVFSSLESWIFVLFCSCIPLLGLIILVLFIRYVRNERKKRPVGLKDKQFSDLQEVVFQREMVDGEVTECSICWEELVQGDSVRFLPCPGKHLFHKECVDPWLSKNDTCPQCRVHIRSIIHKKTTCC